MNMMVKSAGLAGGGSGGGGGGGLAVVVSPSSAYGARSQTGAVQVQTETVTATPTGGSGTYTYLWSKLSGDADWSIVTPTAAATRFKRLNVGELESWVATFKCTVSDGGSSVDSAAVEATVTNYGI